MGHVCRPTFGVWELRAQKAFCQKLLQCPTSTSPPSAAALCVCVRVKLVGSN